MKHPERISLLLSGFPYDHLTQQALLQITLGPSDHQTVQSKRVHLLHRLFLRPVSLDILDTLEADRSSTPNRETISWTLLVDTPCRYDSITALIRAFSTREYLSKTLVAKDISRNCGFLSLSSPTRVFRDRSL